MPSPDKTPANVNAPEIMLPPSEEPSAMALLTSDDDPNSAPVTDLDLADGTSKPAPTDESPNPSLGPNLNMAPNPILDQNQDQVSGAQAILPSTSSNGPAPFDRPTQSSLNPSLFHLNSKPSSPTKALSILKFSRPPPLAS